LRFPQARPSHKVVVAARAGQAALARELQVAQRVQREQQEALAVEAPAGRLWVVDRPREVPQAQAPAPRMEIQAWAPA